MLLRCLKETSSRLKQGESAPKPFENNFLRGLLDHFGPLCWSNMGVGSQVAWLVAVLRSNLSAVQNHQLMKIGPFEV